VDNINSGFSSLTTGNEQLRDRVSLKYIIEVTPADAAVEEGESAAVEERKRTCVAAVGRPNRPAGRRIAAMGR
jgi:hypothetical protein